MTEQELEQAVLGTSITLELTVQEVNVMLSLIGKYPFEEVNGIIKRVHDQGQPQINARIDELKAAAAPADDPEAAA